METVNDAVAAVCAQLRQQHHRVLESYFWQAVDCPEVQLTLCPVLMAVPNGAIADSKVCLQTALLKPRRYTCMLTGQVWKKRSK